MGFLEELDRGLVELRQVVGGKQEMLDRFAAEVEFAGQLAAAPPRQQPEWEGLILRAVAAVREGVARGEGAEQAVTAAEAMLAPIGKIAKQYTIHCFGHAHIDMNWMWGWPETVAVVNDTITTVDRLMDEFPTFRFSQSQASVYQVMKEYLPELYAKVKERVAQGRWEVTASQWVEGDKNLASGEILCRHLLYTKRFMQQEFGLPYDAVQLDFEPDTFGHAHTLPTILGKAGVRWYYFCRAGFGPPLFWWQGPDGARVLAFDDQIEWYNGKITPQIAREVLRFEQATGLKDMLFAYGVGDHGGGPTRRDLRNALAMDEWPIFPNVKLGPISEFFAVAEREAKDLPVVDAEMNCVFEGCYTAQSNIKRANRKSENALVEAEMMALLGRGLAGLPYPREALYAGWRHAMFNQFHDILPGSGVHATYEYAQGLFQEILACTSTVKTRALRAIAARVNTAACECAPAVTAGEIGGGAGDVGAEGAVTRRGAGGRCCDPFVILNPSPWQRSELVTVRLWDRDYADDVIAVRDETGNTLPAQVTERGGYWGHEFIEVAFPAAEVPGLGYRSYCVARSVSPGHGEGCSGDGKGMIENEFLKVEVEQESGAIMHLVDKRTGVDLVPAGARLGLLAYVREAPHGMTAWVIGQAVETIPFLQGAVLDCSQRGPWLASVQVRHKFNDSRFALTISLAAGVPRVDFRLEMDWLERGSPELGVPSLKVTFPLAVEEGVARFECPNGHVVRPTAPRQLPTYTHKWCGTAGIALEAVDVPAQKWVDLTGRQDGCDQPVGATVLNDAKYGHGVNGNTVRLSLVRSSYDPDPLPELGHHTIRFAVQPHIGAWTPSEATRAGYAVNLPFNAVGADVHEGDLPQRQGFAEMLTPNVMVSGMKSAEDSEALIVRLYEMEGKATIAKLLLAPSLAAPDAPAVETDLMEQPLAESTAKMQEGALTVEVPAHGLVTVRVG